MIELSKHIEYLLLSHNCVIVPNLGGFVTQYIPARIIAEENLFLPPCRNIGFNPQLTLNDGLLVQSYMQTYDTSYPETVRLIEEAVVEAKEELQKKGELELHGIGRLILSIDGKYDFEPNEAGVLTPELYALDSFHVKAISPNEEQTADSDDAEKPVAPPTKPKKTYTLSINKELVNYAAAAIAAIFFYFVWATPVAEDTESKESSAAMIVPLPQRNSSPMTYAPRRENTPGEKQAMPKVESKEGKQMPAETEEAPARSGYTLVLLSSVPKANAEAYLKLIKEAGFKDASVYVRGKMVRVVYGCFASESEAYAELNRLHSDKYFAEAWVMQLKPERAKL